MSFRTTAWLSECERQLANAYRLRKLYPDASLIDSKWFARDLLEINAVQFEDKTMWFGHEIAPGFIVWDGGFEVSRLNEKLRERPDLREALLGAFGLRSKPMAGT